MQIIHKFIVLVNYHFFVNMNKFYQQNSLMYVIIITCYQLLVNYIQANINTGL